MVSILEHVQRLLDGFADQGQVAAGLLTVACVAGLLYILYHALVGLVGLIQGFRLYVVSQFCCRTNFVERYGKWVVITGGAGGIGQGIALEFARRGMSIIIIDHNAQRLADTKALLKREPNVGEVETIKADLADASLANYDKIQAQIKPNERDVGVLVNNVGTIPYRMAMFDSYGMKQVALMVNLHVMATLHLTHMMLPGMLRRQRGLILNVSSMAGSFPLAYYSLYAPTKTLVSKFTEQLQVEYHSKPIDIVLLEPGPVLTDLADPEHTRKKLYFFPAPLEYGRKLVGALSARPSFYSGCAAHASIRVLVQCLDNLGLMTLFYKLFFVEGEPDKLAPTVQIEAQRISPQDRAIRLRAWPFSKRSGSGDNKRDPSNA